MAIPNISSSSQALASYAAQLQAVQPRSRESGNDSTARNGVDTPQTGDRVTLSAQSNQDPARSAEARASRSNEVERASSAQAIERKQLNNPEDVRSAASKSVTQALEAYQQAALI